MAHQFSHVAVTVPSDQLQGSSLADLLRFYGDVFGWTESAGFSIPGERLLLRAPTDTQYLTIRASGEPMRTSGYEHLGILTDSEAELREVHVNAARFSSEFPDMELAPIRSLYGGALLTFRIRFRLPLTLELQFLTQRE